ncbi:C2 domain/Copine, putative [Angomonas deanei]|uniref:C2 domain/Copine, putative n=1 Tax=Angomonas deanei TaxID=59799 RepID=A0A7G2C1Q9_9TRYP|nr:C2 domain/Copine, putative [Angomonas deanei]
MNLENKKNKGELIVTAVPVISGTTTGVLQLKLSARDLKKMKTFGKSDPFFMIRRYLTNGAEQAVYTSEIIKKELNPSWRQTPLLDMEDLCGCDAGNRCLTIVCCSGEAKKVIGETDRLTADELCQCRPGKEMELRVRDGKKREVCQGTLIIQEARFTPTVSFLGHLQAGLEINIAFSIDFTGSNGDWRKPNSLHYHNPQRPNDYLQAMLAVSNVVQEYDTDRQFPAFGFGAVTPFTRGTSHFFPLNGNAQNAYCNGMQEVIDTYARLLPQLQFSGPTNFAPTIRNVCEGARHAPRVYTILLILTDGAITDMQDTIDAIVDADDAPLSIVIIGIGNANFSSMVRLDGDEEPLQHKDGRITRRDLVQFVPFNEFRARGPEQLAAEVLYEIPKQVEVWGRLNNIQY